MVSGCLTDASSDLMDDCCVRGGSFEMILVGHWDGRLVLRKWLLSRYSVEE